MKSQNSIIQFGFLLLVVSTFVADVSSKDWDHWGYDLNNDLNVEDAEPISPETIGNATLRWIFTGLGDISAFPTSRGDTLFVVDWGGGIYAINRLTGVALWNVSTSSITGVPGSFVRTSPVVTDGLLLMGATAEGASHIWAMRQSDGSVVWKTLLSAHPFSQMTQSGVVWQGHLYVGTSSTEETAALFVPGYTCCSFIGTFFKIRVSDGSIVWSLPMAPSGYAGQAVWGSSPAINTKTKTVYIATGNSYSVPPAVDACIANATGNGNLTLAGMCYDPNVHFDSILAINTDTGSIRWSRRLSESDSWNLHCGIPGVFPPTPGCPSGNAMDFDFGQAPVLKRNINFGHGDHRDYVITGQKSGQVWALDANTGATAWVTNVCPGGFNGGIMWGSASDKNRFYVGCSNFERITTPLSNGLNTTGGTFAALDIKTGTIEWLVEDPSVHTGTFFPYSQSPLTLANGVLFASSYGGYFYAFDALDGSLKWSYSTDTANMGGVTVIDGSFYVGSGYKRATLIGDNRLFAFSVPYCG